MNTSVFVSSTSDALAFPLVVCLLEKTACMHQYRSLPVASLDLVLSFTGCSQITNPPVKGMDCGIIHDAQVAAPLPLSITQMAACFFQAHPHCQEATLPYDNTAAYDAQIFDIFFTQSQQGVITAVVTITSDDSNKVTQDTTTCDDIEQDFGCLEFDLCGKDHPMIFVPQTDQG